MIARRASWVVMGAVLVAALAIGITDRSPQTTAERVRDIAATIKCPTCRSQSVADSEAPAAKFLRIEIARRVEQGQSADEIRAFAASRYGSDVLLTPERSGLAGLVWVLPVALGVVAAGFVVLALRRWQAR